MLTSVQIKVPCDFKSGASKGFAFAEYVDTQSAEKAIEDLDGNAFQGRLLHLLPAASKPGNKIDEFAIAQLPLKKRRMIEKKQGAASSTFNWNSMYMNVCLPGNNGIAHFD